MSVSLCCLLQLTVADIAFFNIQDRVSTKIGDCTAILYLYGILQSNSSTCFALYYIYTIIIQIQLSLQD
jgi:hypothetical protein